MLLAELLPFAAIAVGFWLLLIRPIRQRKARQAAVVAALAPGQRVMTTAGIFGIVQSVDGERVRVEVAPGVVIEMLSVAIAQVGSADLIDDPAIDAEAQQGSARVDGPGGSGTASAPGQEPERG